MSSSIIKTPVYVELDRRRELVFNLNSEIIVQRAGKRGLDLYTKIGEEKGGDGIVRDTLDLNLENFSLYLFAALQRDMKAHGELLTVDDIGDLVNSREKAAEAFGALIDCLDQYYGRVKGTDPGER